MDCSADSIEHFHENLERALASELPTEPDIVPPEGFENWPTRGLGLEVTFGFQPSKPFCVASGKHPTILLPLTEGDYKRVGLVGWREEWKSLGQGNFRLIGLAWSFHWGTAVDHGSRRLLFRAEWDNRAQRGEQAPQPHWHAGPAAVEEIAFVEKFHFGMAGWNVAAGTHPWEYWQLPTCDSEPRDAICWAVRVLQSVKREMPEPIEWERVG
jgi:hypothetical protein